MVGPVFSRPSLDEKGQEYQQRNLCLVGVADHAIIDGYPLAQVACTLANYARKAYGLDGGFIRKMKTYFPANPTDTGKVYKA